jgi:chemotaxis protein MotA
LLLFSSTQERRNEAGLGILKKLRSRPIVDLEEQARSQLPDSIERLSARMFVIIGSVVVIIAILGGFMMEGGKLMLLVQVAEFLIIGGAMIGTLMVSAPAPLLKKIVVNLAGVIKPNVFNKSYYIKVLNLLHELFQTARVGGLLALEEHVEQPQNSPIMGKYPVILQQKEVVAFVTDTLRLLTVGTTASDLEAIMDADAETQHQEGQKPSMLLNKVGDSLPGFGIVAAVLGIVVTMQAITGPPEQIGHKVAAALVGTFLGVLFAYGFVNPIATNIELAHEEKAAVYHVIKAGITAFANGLHPLYAVEFARRSIMTEFRPTFQEMEDSIKNAKAAESGEGGDSVPALGGSAEPEEVLIGG